MPTPSASAVACSNAMPWPLSSSSEPSVQPGSRTSSTAAPSTPVMRNGNEPAVTRPTCQPLTAATSGCSPNSTSRSLGRPPRVKVPESTTRSDRMSRSTSPSTERANDARKTARPATTAVASSSAPVVAAVRDRLRTASRAPMRDRAAGRVGTIRMPAATASDSTVGRNASRPTTTTTAVAVPSAVGTATSPSSISPDRSATAPMPTRTAFAILTGQGIRGSAGDSATASIGATLQARMAGTIAANTVATVPMTTAPTSAGTETTEPPTGMEVPRAPMAPSMSRPSSRPSGAPSSDATAANPAASMSAAASSWRWWAPTRRSAAKVRRRSEYSSVSELATVTMPTTSASSANPVIRTRMRVKLRVMLS